MAIPTDGESPFKDRPASGVDPATTETFGLLSDGTRLAILLALWDRAPSGLDARAVPFSELFEAVEYDDPGNFRYHLERLEGSFVERREEGYAIRTTGLKLVRAIVAGAGVQDRRVDPTVVEEACPFCDAATTVAYRDGLVVHACTDCEGAMPDAPADGCLSLVPFDPAGLHDRTPAELRAASALAALREIQQLFEGFCPACSGPVEGSLAACPDHGAEDGVCQDCGHRAVALAHFRCRRCRNHKVDHPGALPLFHPATVAFYHDHDAMPALRSDDPAALRECRALLDDHELELTGTDPPRLAITARLGDDARTLIVDESVRVVAVEQ